MPSTGGFSGSSSENIQHYGAVRLRINGIGNLIQTFFGLDNVLTQVLASLAMSNNPGVQPRVLSNFINQRARLELKTVAIDEVMRVNRILIFIKPIWTEYPG